MFFDNTTRTSTRRAMDRAHEERGKILGEVWGYLTGHRR